MPQAVQTGRMRPSRNISVVGAPHRWQNIPTGSPFCAVP
jgi:hypothetical protein